MAPQNKLTEYELRRLENIKRNDQMLASLNIQSKLTELSYTTKRQRSETNNPYKVSPENKSKTQTQIVIRRSLRSRGIPPEWNPKWNPPSPKPVPIPMRNAYCGDPNDRKLAKTILGVSKNTQLLCEDDKFGYPIRVSGSVELESMRLEPENIAKVVPGMTMVVRFFPSMDIEMVAVGNKFGNIGFWNFGAVKDKDGGDGIYRYHPHSGPVSGIALQPFSLSKVYSSCYNGFIRLMDVEKEVFDLVYSSDCAIFSISQRPNDVNSLYFSEGRGVVNVWDERAGKSSTSWTLHIDRINSIDFSPENTNIMATSSTDGTACIWDLRYIYADRPKTLKTVSHKRAVYSAYFSPSGTCLATTSIDEKVGCITGANFEDITMIHHYNNTSQSINSFRGIWGWDDSYVFIGNTEKGVDVISTAQRKNVTTLQSPCLSSIPCRFDAHPYKIGMLAGGATTGGQVYIWTK